MIEFQIQRDPAPSLAAYMEHVRERIIAALRIGMNEAMHDLAEYVVDSKLAGNPIGIQKTPGEYTKPGDLAESILEGVRVGSNGEEVYGTLSGRPKNMPNLGYWQEFGTSHPEQSGHLNVFIGRDGTPVFTRRIQAFSIQPRPFLNPSLEEQRPEIIDTIRRNLAEADLSS